MEYKTEIIKLLQQIDNKEFLERMYISMREYVKEKQQVESEDIKK